jgi:hypothetical protein
MLWSLLNSVKGKSALSSFAPADHLQPEIIQTALPDRIPPVRPTPAGAGGSIRPEKCCVYCGHLLYAPPRVPRVRCPRCSQEMAIKDVILSGDVREERIVTAGKIVVTSTARVEAELVACNIEIAGRVLGSVLASYCCRLKPTAKVAGNILSRHLEIDPGALLEGQVELVREPLPAIP